MSREEKFLKNALILAFGTLLPKITSFIILPILTGSLTQKEYGTYDLICVLVSLFLPATTLQIQAAAFRFLIDARKNTNNIKKIITNILAFLVPISLVSLCILYFCLWFLNPNIRILICIYFFVDIYYNTFLQIVRGLAINLSYSISSMINSFGMMIFVILFVLILKCGLIGSIISLTLSALFALLFLFINHNLYQYIDMNLVSKNTLKELLAYSWPMVPNSISMWVMTVSDRLVVTVFLGITANSVYSVANKIPSLLTLAQNTFSMAWQENASMYSHDNDIGIYYSTMFRTLFDFIAGFMGLLISMTPILFMILIKGDYSAAYIQIPILILGMFFFALSSFLGGIYIAYKETKKVGITTALAAICNLVVDMALVKFIGLFAASGSTLISYVFLFVYRLKDIQKVVKIDFSLWHMVWVVFFLSVECIICSFDKGYLNFINFVLAFIIFGALNHKLATVIIIKLKGKCLKR